MGLCAYCDEPIRLIGDDFENWANGQQVHRECGIRAIAGSAAHQLHECFPVS